jgi:hypothetical protein
MGKYGRRIYATPDAEEGYRALFASTTSPYYLVVDVPHLYDSGFYGRFFAKCDVMYEAASRKISGKVYDCAKALKVISSI